ncbi:hypothetical protein N5079_12370 [Planotetraspora sp. A-T 1434]|uniref:hypothetical protein n=1 Tax=Planotetraspora sp. A-T 1434 TaxID=2979219 RepID=UPI0021BFEA8A|nr:hypothetical protein [Planotetraspora sp. A-T 1434]MCT9931013.1 hypothetical protein [Planotetraspora sp. A-T 1434]
MAVVVAVVIAVGIAVGIAVVIWVIIAVVIVPGIAVVIGIVIACVSCSLVSRHVRPVKPGRFGAGQFEHVGPLLWPGWRWLVRRWPVQLYGAGLCGVG